MGIVLPMMRFLMGVVNLFAFLGLFWALAHYILGFLFRFMKVGGKWKVGSESGNVEV